MSDHKSWPARPAKYDHPFTELTTFPQAPPGRGDYTRNDPPLSMESREDMSIPRDVYDVLAAGPMTLEQISDATVYDRHRCSTAVSHMRLRWGTVKELSGHRFQRVVDPEERKQLIAANKERKAKRAGQGTFNDRAREAIRGVMLEGLVCKNTDIVARTGLKLKQVHSATKELRKRGVIATSQNHEHRLNAQHLSGEERVIITLRHRGECSGPDIARNLGIVLEDGSMVLAPMLERGVITFNPQTATYSLPPTKPTEEETEAMPSPFTDLVDEEIRDQVEQGVRISNDLPPFDGTPPSNPIDVDVSNEQIESGDTELWRRMGQISAEINRLVFFVRENERQRAKQQPVVIDDLDAKLQTLDALIKLFGSGEAVDMLTGIKTDLLTVAQKDNEPAAKMPR